MNLRHWVNESKEINFLNNLLFKKNLQYKIKNLSI